MSAVGPKFNELETDGKTFYFVEPAAGSHAIRAMLDQIRSTPPKRRTSKQRNVPSWMLRLGTQSRKNAKSRGIAYALTDADLAYLAARCKNHCEVSGIAFEHAGLPNARAPFRPSLDRIDCRSGYRRENVRVVCAVANMAMNEWGLDPVLRFAHALIRRQRENQEK